MPNRLALHVAAFFAGWAIGWALVFQLAAAFPG